MLNGKVQVRIIAGYERHWANRSRSKQKSKEQGKEGGVWEVALLLLPLPTYILYSIRYQGVRAGIRGEEGASRPKIDKDGKRRATGLRLLYFSAAPVPGPKTCLGLCLPLSDGELVPNVGPSDTPSKHARCCRDQVEGTASSATQC